MKKFHCFFEQSGRERNPTKAFILKCKLEAYEDLLKDGGK